MTPIPLRSQINHVLNTHAYRREQAINYLTIAIAIAVAVWFFAAFIVPDVVLP